MRSIVVRPFSLSALTLTTLFAACGGGGGGSSEAVIGLTPPDEISVVTPQESAALPVDPDFALDADYHQDTVHRHVYDPAVEPLDTVNMILCLIDQTAVDRLVNEGPYLAQVNATKCDPGGGSSEAGQSSGDDNVAHEVFDEHGILIRAFRDGLLILPLEQGVKLGTGRAFDQPDQVLDPDRFRRTNLHGHFAALVVRAMGADRLGARA